ncbi:MAG: GtrA family protein [Jiangellales bacterium]
MLIPDATLSRLRSASGEIARFLTVGGVGFVVDVTVFNLLRFNLGLGDGEGVLVDKPLTAKIISVVVATIVTYTGNRAWTWRHRERTGVVREYALFFVLNGIAMAIAVVTLAISHYVLGFTSPLADNIAANVVGLALGTAFRFWSYRRWVFKAPQPQAVDVTG